MLQKIARILAAVIVVLAARSVEAKSQSSKSQSPKPQPPAILRPVVATSNFVGSTTSKVTKTTVGVAKTAVKAPFNVANKVGRAVKNVISE